MAQPGFNLIEDLGLPNNHLRDMIVDNDTLVGYGLAYDTNSQLQGLLLAKFDSSGNFLSSKMIVDALGDLFSIGKHWGKIIKTSDGGYALTAATVYRKSAFLIKLDNDLEVEFIREYPDTVNLANFRYTPVEIGDGYLLYGHIQRPNYMSDGFVRRVDKQGNTVWFQYFGSYPQDDAIVDLRMLNDSVMVAASVEGVSGAPSWSTRSVLRYINLEGVVLQSWASVPEPDIGYLYKVLPLPDGGLITYGVYVAYINSFGTKVVQSTLAKFSHDFQKQWVKHYGLKNEIGAVMLWDIEPTLDGSFIGAGQSYIPLDSSTDAHSAWLFKFSAQGDSIWSRYDTGPFTFQYYNQHAFGGVGILSSGNIVAGGAAFEGQKPYIWLVKVTPDGCLDTLYCGLVDTKEARPARPSGEVRIYPNPATEAFVIEFDRERAGAVICLYNTQGMQVAEQVLKGHAQKTTLPVSHLPAGVYFVTVRTPEGPLGQSKIFIGK